MPNTRILPSIMPAAETSDSTIMACKAECSPMSVSKKPIELAFI